MTEDPYISFMIWKGIALLSVVGVVAFWEGYTGKKLFNRDDGSTHEPYPQETPDSAGHVRIASDEKKP